MLKRAYLSVALGAAFLALTAIPNLKASGFENDKTIVTFSGPVDIGNHELAAGTYIFRTLSDGSKIVEIMNQDETHLVGLFDTIPVKTPDSLGNSRIVLSEGAENGPARVKEWFYPGTDTGWEFLPVK